MTNLPARVDVLADPLRVMFARSTLQSIGDQARQQVAVHTYAQAAASEVLHVVSSLDAPNYDDLIALAQRHVPEILSADENVSTKTLVQKMVTLADSTQGVSHKSVTRDVLSQVHPDRQPASTGGHDDAAELFKTMSAAVQDDDSVTVQAMYAAAVTSRIVGSPTASADKLEQERYKAWLALQAGKGRFATTDEVDGWKEREVALAPYRIRASQLGIAANLFTKSLGRTEAGRIELPQVCLLGVTDSFVRVRAVRQKVNGDDITTRDFASIDLEGFDRRMSILVGQVDTLFRMREIYGKSWSSGRIICTNNFAHDLGTAAQKLEKPKEDPNQRLGNFIISNFFGSYGNDHRSSYFENNPNPYPHRVFDELIFNTDRYRQEGFNEY